MVKNVINIFVAVGFLLHQFLSLAVSLLQLLRPEPYTNNTGFIRLLIGELSSEVILDLPKLWQNIGSTN